MNDLERPRAVFGWTMYDWANSAFATTVMAGFFPVFFKQYWSEGVDVTLSTARLGVANAISGIVVAAIAPILGAIADRGSSRRKFLFFFAVMGIVMTGGLYMVARGDWGMAVALYVIAVVGFSGGNIFYDSLLPSVAKPEKRDWVSSLGYGMGYLGGGVLFALNVWMVRKPDVFGFADAAAAVKFSFVCVAVWWAVFTIPLLLFVPEPGNGRSAGRGAIRAGYRQLVATFHEIRYQRTIFLFLLAYWLYIDGVDTIVRMAVDYGMSLGFDPNSLLVALLLVQFIGFPAAITFGYLGGRLGTRRMIFVGIAVYLAITAWAAFMDNVREFYVLACAIGLVQGGVQALSRSFYSRIIPPDKAAEYFGFYNMMGKFATVIGPLLIGGVGLAARAGGMSATASSRVGIASVSLMFLAGGILFWFVDEDTGRREAEYLAGDEAE
ncbi:MAG: MFS transporter [Candidatus Glassbacteria bacterium]|nr:MFS transporter [Candidatus Glassbacteria bacterium]